jgi:CheY-like chemotaxis protein
LLLVEDNPDVLAVLAAHLEDQGYTVHQAEHGAAALALINGGLRPDALVTDLTMPGDFDGLDLVRETRAQLPHLPAVLVTGNIGDAAVDKLAAAQDGGPFSLLRKPTPARDLLQRVARVLADAGRGAIRARRAPEAGSTTAPAAPLPADEAQRLAALHAHEILDTTAEAAFDDLTRTAAEVTGSPIALISLVDAERQWFKSRHGLDTTETPRDFAFSAHAILAPGHQLVVRDARADPRFATNPLVTGAPGIRAYVGTPLVDADGHALGTLCVIDQVPRAYSCDELSALGDLAEAAKATLEVRRSFLRAQRSMASGPRRASMTAPRSIIGETTAGRHGQGQTLPGVTDPAVESAMRKVSAKGRNNSHR